MFAALKRLNIYQKEMELYLEGLGQQKEVQQKVSLNLPIGQMINHLGRSHQFRLSQHKVMSH